MKLRWSNKETGAITVSISPGWAVWEGFFIMGRRGVKDIEVERGGRARA